MLINVKVNNVNLETVIEYQTEVNAEAMIEFAKERAPMMREKGKTFAQGAVPFWCGELVKAVEAGDEEKIEYAAINSAMTAWLADSIYSGLTEREFLASDLYFTLEPTGMVVYTRKPAK
ncbi:hypothetical protein GLZ14_20600 [Salmonella enterica]|nr:hypothetical protein [Salmonella enterica subsp. enterica serovar Chester]EEB5205321.1 hypothetical protein [Salmonella enterica]EFT7565448.1 hypothetical protein [Salmonella enterica]